jgi:hypothetical protein
MTSIAGGAATFQGTDFQARVSAWLASRSIVGHQASPLWDWPQDAQIDAIWMETSDAVDDIRVDAGPNRSAYIQAKHTTTLSTKMSSPFGKAMLQFVRQYSASRPADRLVLATASTSSRPVLQILPAMLARLRQTGNVEPGGMCVNALEIQVRSKLVELVETCWRDVVGQTPTQTQLLNLLSRLYVVRIDPYDDQVEGREANQFLRSRLEDPSQAGTAWDVIVNSMSQTATLRARVTPGWLEALLQNRGIALTSPPMFGADIAALRRWSESVMTRLSEYSSMLGDDGRDIHIRREFLAALTALAPSSCLVTGDPGAGKSGSLLDLAESLGPDTDIVFLSADALASRTLGALKDELGLQHPLVDVFSSWSGVGHGYLIVDALDAGRGSDGQRALLDLIGGVLRQRGRWRVVASVRRFDLKYSPELQDLFRGGADPNQLDRLAEFSGVRHLHVPQLSATELADLARIAPNLHRHIAAASFDLQRLLKNFFCLRLYADLLQEQSSQSLGDIASRASLLERYWARRASIGTPLGARLDEVLRTATQLMIRTGVLTVGWTSLVRPETAEDVAVLLRSGVLTEGIHPSNGARSISFAHHVLFDYAVAFLIFREGETSLAAQIRANRTLLFVARPSLQMYFEHLWELSGTREAFWLAALELARAEEIPEIARVIAPGVAALALSESSDIHSLISWFDSNRESTLNVLRHLFTAHFQIIENEASQRWQPVWLPVVKRLAGDIEIDTVVVLRNLLRAFTKDDPTPDAHEVVGGACRALLEWSWRVGSKDRFFLYVAIRGVCMTYSSDLVASARLLRSVIDAERLADRGYLDLPLVAQHLDLVWPDDPALAADVYVAAFRHHEESTESTPMVTGVLSMTSNRRQDYDMAHHSLKELAPGFLAAAPGHAIPAIAEIGLIYSSRYGYRPDTLAVNWQGAVAHIMDDSFWDRDHHGDEEWEILRAFRGWLAPGEGHPQADHPGVAIDLLRSIPSPAAMWRALLEELSSEGRSLEPLLPILASPVAILSPGLARPIREALESGFARLPAEAKQAIELAIEELGDEPESRENRLRDRLILSLDGSGLRSEVLLSRLRELTASHTSPESDAPSSWTSERDDEDVYLRDIGIDLDLAHNAAIVPLRNQLSSFLSDHLNDPPALSASAASWPLVRQLFDALSAQDVDPRLAGLGMDDVGRAVEIMARTAWPASLDDEDRAALYGMILTLSHLDAPEDPGPNYDGHSWPSSARTSAAQSIIWLLRQGEGRSLRPRLLEMIEDPSIYVRLGILRYIRALAAEDPECVEAVVKFEMNRETSGSAFARFLVMLSYLPIDTETLLDRTNRIYEKAVRLGDTGKEAREVAFQISSGRYIWQGAPIALDATRRRMNDVSVLAFELDAIQDGFRSAFESNMDGGAVRSRAFSLALEVQAAAASHHLELQLLAVDASSEDLERIRTEIRGWGQVLDGIATDAYYSSGAYTRDEADPRQDISEDEYYRVSRPVLLALLEIPYPSIVHHVIQTLYHVSSAAPREVFLDIALAVSKGRESAYESDLSGEPLLVSIVSRYLAQDRGMFRSDEPCREALIDILDTLVASGSTSATTLTYQLQEIFR